MQHNTENAPECSFCKNKVCSSILMFLQHNATMHNNLNNDGNIYYKQIQEKILCILMYRR